MKSDKVSAELLEELERWQRPFSPLTVFSSTVKAQAGEQDVKSGEKSSETDSEFESMYGDLPENVQAQLKEVATLKQKEADYQKQLEAKDKEARVHQSRADQALAKLQAHNLLDQGPQARGIEADPVYQEILQDLKAEGIPEANLDAAARVQYKIHQRAVKASTQGVQQYLQPTLQSLGNIEADRYFAMAVNNDKDGYLRNPEISSYVKTELEGLVKTGNDINEKTVDFILSMAIGDQIRQGKPIQPQQQQISQPMNFSTRQTPMNTGAFSNGNVLQTSSGAPRPKDDNHAKAIATVVGIWKQGLPPKGGKR